MKNLKISIFDNDYAVQAVTHVDFNNDGAANQFMDFIEKIKGELIANEATHIEIEGLQDESIIFSISPYV